MSTLDFIDSFLISQIASGVKDGDMTHQKSDL